jgi:hypothetical protein
VVYLILLIEYSVLLLPVLGLQPVLVVVSPPVEVAAVEELVLFK